MTVCVNNQYRLATWDHDLAGAGSLTDEHRKKTIREETVIRFLRIFKEIFRAGFYEIRKGN